MRVSILGGAYSAPNLIANAQRSINLYPETNPKTEGAPTPVTHYPRPGLTLLAQAPSAGHGRALYRATNGDLYALIDQTLYYISQDWVFTSLGQTVTPGTTPAYMADNGQDLMLVDGSTQGYTVHLANRAMAQIGDPLFLGGDRVAYVDTFFVLNQPGTSNWYSSLSLSLAFNGLDIGTKTAFPDPIVSIAVSHRLVWLFGTLKSEVWYNAGTQGFPFQAAPGVMVEHGCAARYSVATQDVRIYWLSQSPEGDRMVMAGGTDYSATRISTHAIEAELKSYPRVDDAIGACYQQAGHGFYKLHFPTADKTWVFDAATEEWHERRSADTNGVLHRERDAFCAFAYGQNVALDWSTGALYSIDPSASVDQVATGTTRPIVCIRSFPHLSGDKFQRVQYKYLIADVQGGTQANTLTTAPPQISLRYSDDRGVSFGDAMLQSFGSAGQYQTAPKWSRLGMSRDRVFELSWSIPAKTALNGVFVEMEALET